MALGLGLLRLSPEAFWSMTFPEFAAAIRGLKGETAPADAPDAETFRALMRLFPDERRTPHDR